MTSSFQRSLSFTLGMTRGAVLLFEWLKRYCYPNDLVYNKDCRIIFVAFCGRVRCRFYFYHDVSEFDLNPGSMTESLFGESRLLVV